MHLQEMFITASIHPLLLVVFHCWQGIHLGAGACCCTGSRQGGRLPAGAGASATPTTPAELFPIVGVVAAAAAAGDASTRLATPPTREQRVSEAKQEQLDEILERLEASSLEELCKQQGGAGKKRMYAVAFDVGAQRVWYGGEFTTYKKKKKNTAEAVIMEFPADETKLRLTVGLLHKYVQRDYEVGAVPGEGAHCLGQSAIR